MNIRRGVFRSAFTSIELLVVVGILMLLAAIVLPAIQMVRASAWGTVCKSRMRALWLAVHQYHDSHGTLPFLDQVQDYPTTTAPSFFSIQSALLPFIEESTVFDALNHAAGLPSGHIAAVSLWAHNTTASNARVATFLCPADGETTRWNGAVSYRANMGVGPYHNRSAEFPDSFNGFFISRRLRFEHIYDGVANVAMFSERLVGNGSLQLPGEGRPILAVPLGTWNELKSANGTAILCAQVSATPPPHGGYEQAGKYWLFAGLHHTYYCHVLPPNALVPDCQVLWDFPSGASTARSFHRGGVHVTRGDGSVSFVSNSVSLEVWRGLGSRDGAEISVGL